jgi:hypothetical protein
MYLSIPKCPFSELKDFPRIFLLSRVTGLGEFSPFGRLFAFTGFGEITKITHLFGQLLYTVKVV